MAPTAVASASVNCLSSSSLLSEKTVVTRNYWHCIVVLILSPVVTSQCSHYTTTTPGSEWVMINQMSLNFLCRRIPWLWSGSQTSRLAQHICIDCPRRPCHRGHKCSRDCLFGSAVLRLKPGRLKGSHPMNFTNLSFCSTLCWVFLVALTSLSGPNHKSVGVNPKQTNRPQSDISVTAIIGRRQLTFLLSMTTGFPVQSKMHKILFA